MGISRAGSWTVGLGAVLVLTIASAGCSNDDPATASSEPTSQVTVAPAPAPTEQVDGTTEGSNRSGGTSETADTEDPNVESTPADEEPADDPAPETTAPTTSDGGGDESTTDADPTLPPVPASVPGPTVVSDLDEEAEFGTGVVASIVSVEAVEVVGRLPGERSGPGVLVTIQVDNDSDEQISLDYVTVDLIRADGASAIPVDTSEPNDFSGDLAAGEMAIADYQFFLPVEERASATITVSYASGVATALFAGDLPDV